MPLVHVSGWLRARARRTWGGRPVDPDYGVDEGAGPGQPGEPEIPDQGGPGGFPGFPERPGHGLPWPGFPDRPSHGLPPSWGGVDPGWGVPEIPGLPGIPDQGPVVPGRPGHPLPRPPVPVVKAVPLPEGVELPEGKPHEPGCACIVVEGKSNKRALGWLQGVANLPRESEPDEAPDQGLPPGQPRPPRPPRPTVGGHWVAVDADPLHACAREGGDDCHFAYVFEIDASFGKPTPH